MTFFEHSKVKILLKIAALGAVAVFTAGVFINFAKMLGGKVLWPEVILAIGFVIAFIVFIDLLKSAVRWGVRKVTDKMNNFYLREILRWSMMALFWVFVIFPLFLATFTLTRPKIGDGFDPQTALGIPFKRVTLKTKDGLKLDGWYIPAGSKKTVIIGHGLGANKSNFLMTAEFWRSLGYNALIFDFRGHGQSEGHIVSFGYKERLDIEAGLDYLVSRKDIDPSVIIGYGVSFGGAAMIQAAAEDKRLKAIIIDSAYADLKTMGAETVKRTGFVPGFLVNILSDLGLFAASLECGIDLVNYSPQKAIAKITQPILLIHGKQDDLIDWHETEKLFAAARQPKFLFFVDTKGHYRTMEDAGYTPAVIKFLETVK